MRTTRIPALLAGLVLAAAAAAGGAARADGFQTPVATGCPAGFTKLSVAWLEAAGPYKEPALIDAAGNDDGYVCALALPDAVRDAWCANGRGGCLLEQLGLPLYQFVDDDNPASR